MKLNNVKKSIGWADYTLNPIKGICPVACPYCYARRIYNRFKMNPKISLDLSVFDGGINPKEPSKIFVCSTIDIFAKGIKYDWLSQILNRIGSDKNCHKHRFMFLTKFGNNYNKHIFPDNCWLGVTFTDKWQYNPAPENRKNIDYLSVEPLMREIEIEELGYPKYIIIGGMTPKNCHKKEWVDKIVNWTEEEGIETYIKSNLHYKLMRQVI